MKKEFSKLLISLFATSMCFSFASCGGSESKEQVKLYIDMYGNQSETIYFPYSFNIEKYINVNDEPDQDIAKVSMLFSAISSSCELYFLNSKKIETKVANFKEFASYMNLDDYEECRVGENAEIDADDITRVYLTHKKLSVKNKSYDICFASFEDSGGNRSWASNFDMGCNDESYYSKTGEHPEWTTKENHKGFDVAANRSVTVINSYISNHLDQNSQQILYIFGLSRGAAVGNIAGAKLIDEGKNVVQYGLACPATTSNKNANADKYKHLFTYLNTEDIITRIPLEKWGFTRYGQSFTFAISEYKNRFEVVNGFELPYGAVDIFVKALGRIGPTREILYQPNDNLTVYDENYATEEEANAAIAEQKSKFKGELEQFIIYSNFEVVSNEDGTYKAKVTTCVGFLLSVLGYCITNYSYDINQLRALFGQMGNYLDCFLNASKLSVTVFVSVSIQYIIYAHFFYTYATYFNPK